MSLWQSTSSLVAKNTAAALARRSRGDMFRKGLLRRIGKGMLLATADSINGCTASLEKLRSVSHAEQLLPVATNGPTSVFNIGVIVPIGDSSVSLVTAKKAMLTGNTLAQLERGSRPTRAGRISSWAWFLTLAAITSKIVRVPTAGRSFIRDFSASISARAPATGSGCAASHEGALLLPEGRSEWHLQRQSD